MGAAPTVMNTMPSAAEIRPLIRDLPARLAISVRAKIETEKYSAGPNFRAKFAITGETNTSTRMPKMVPRKENTVPTPSALYACPFFAIGLPSKQVATEAGVPGMLMRIAAIRPPDTAPM